MPLVSGNVIIPFFMVAYWWGYLLIIPVILLESAIIHFFLKEPSFKKVLIQCAWANLISTACGLIFTLFGGVIGFTISFILSIFIESYYLGKKLGTSIRRQTWIAVMIANLVSYLALLMVQGFLENDLSRKRLERPRRIVCASNLKQIGLALRMYSQENKEFFPPYDGALGLEMLRAGGYLDDNRIYVCPSAFIDRMPERGTRITEDNCSYVYRGGLKESDPPDSPIAWDKDRNHSKYGNILYVDGHVTGYAGSSWKLGSGESRR